MRRPDRRRLRPERPARHSSCCARRLRGRSEPEAEDRGIGWLGIRYQEMTDGLRETHGLPEGLAGVWITTVSPRSPLYDEGVTQTQNVITVITEVNGDKVGSVESFEDAVKGVAPGKRLRLYLRRFVEGREQAPLFAFPRVPEE